MKKHLKILLMIVLFMGVFYSVNGSHSLAYEENDVLVKFLNEAKGKKIFVEKNDGKEASDALKNMIHEKLQQGKLKEIRNILETYNAKRSVFTEITYPVIRTSKGKPELE